MSKIKTVLLWCLAVPFIVARCFNLLEPNKQGEVPVIDYFPIVSISKTTAWVGVFFTAWLIVSGAPDTVDLIASLSTAAGGVGAYRARQWLGSTPDINPNVDDPDKEP